MRLTPIVQVKKQYEILRIILNISDDFQKAIEKNVLMDDLIKMKSLEHVARLKNVPNKDIEKKFTKTEKEIDKELSKLISGGN